MSVHIRALIIDDEPKSVALLEVFLKNNYPDVEIVGSTTVAQQALAMIKDLNPNLVFADIDMPLINGIELVSMFDETAFAVIYITAYDNYAVKALRINTVDYLLKPLREKDLVFAVEKARKRIQELKKISQQNPTVTALIRKIAIPDVSGFTMINLDDVIYCKGDGSYTTFYTCSGHTYTVSQNIGEYEKQFFAMNFLRIHNSYLVNIQHVVKYIKGRGGIVVMSDKTEIDVAVRKKQQLLDALQGRLSDFT